MRLSQVALKLKLSRNVVVGLLRDQGYRIENNPGVRLSTKQINCLIKLLALEFNIDADKEILNRPSEQPGWLMKPGIRTCFGTLPTQDSNSSVLPPLGILESIIARVEAAFYSTGQFDWSKEDQQYLFYLENLAEAIRLGIINGEISRSTLACRYGFYETVTRYTVKIFKGLVQGLFKGLKKVCFRLMDKRKYLSSIIPLRFYHVFTSEDEAFETNISFASL